MRKQKSVLENETQKILRDFEIQMNQFSTRRSDLVIVTKKKKESVHNSGLWRPGEPQAKTERKRIER